MNFPGIPAALAALVLGGVSPSSASPVAGEIQALWSLKPLASPPVPAGAAHPVDAFIGAKLSERQIGPSKAADRKTLLRRAYYDLTGLPPSPEEVDAFAADDGPEDWNAVVRKLLDSPGYGEHWARHWLDIANYADTHGNDHDYARPNAWPYRDYVIHSFNDDKPYARFLQEQVAGDALFPDDPQATVALGFVAAGPWDHTLMVTVREDTVDHRIAQNLDRDSMVSTVMGTFQSLTVHCARCHDHKFDPIPQRDYYALQAVFAGVDRADRPFDADSRIHEQRFRLLADQAALRQPDAAFLAGLTRAETLRKVEVWESDRAIREKSWTPLEVVSVVSTGGSQLTRQADGSWFASGSRPERDTYVVTAQLPAGRLGALRLETLADDRLPQGGPGRWDNGNFHLTEFRAFASAPGSESSALPLLFSKARADHNEGPAISAGQAIDGNNETHWGIHPRYGGSHEAVFDLKDHAAIFQKGTVLTLLLEHQAGAPGHGVGRFRLSASHEESPVPFAGPLPRELGEILRIPSAARTPAQSQALALAVLRQENGAALAALPPPEMVYAITNNFPPDGENFKPAPQPRPIHLLARGELSKPGERMVPGALHCLPGLSGDLETSAGPDNESSRRAALARWLADDRNVLTWRSIVNRMWAWHFGKGLCDTPNDFGNMGGPPSHPELLDWLAVWFRDEAKGSLKALHHLILTSDTWRQSTLTGHGTSSDPDNRLLWRQNRLRLSGEEVRDTLLSLSGKLDLTMGGPSAVQFNSRGDATFNAGGNPPFLDYSGFDQDSPAARRRSIYRFLFRTIPDPLMDALDCPDGGSATPVRGESTTAVQAFALLNNPFVIRQCELIAGRLEAAAASAESSSVREMFRLILLRPPTPAEESRFSAYASRHGLANAVQVLINSNEFLYVD